MRRIARAPISGRASRRGRFLFLAGMMALLSLALAMPAVAERVYECQITGSATPSSTECNGTGNVVPGFSPERLGGIAIDSSDSLWVSDSWGAMTRVTKYDPSGNYIGQAEDKDLGPEAVERMASSFTAGTLNSVGQERNLGGVSDIRLWSFDSAGAFVSSIAGPLSEWGEFSSDYPKAIAADNSGGPTDGYLYISASPRGVFRVDGNANPVDFSASGDPSKPYIDGNQLTGIPGRSFSVNRGGIWDLAVDSDGNLYVLDRGTGPGKRVVYVFDSSGTFVRELTGTPTGPGGAEVKFGGKASSTESIFGAVAVDPTNDHILVSDPNLDVIHEFDAAGNFISDITDEGVPGGLLGDLDGTVWATSDIQVDSSGRLYVTNTSTKVVNVLGHYVVQPKVTYGEPSDFTLSTAKLHATIDPNGGGNVTACQFEYGTDTTYSLGTVPCSPLTPYGSPTEVSATVTGLSKGVVYHYRVVTTNSTGQAKAADKTFAVVVPPEIDLQWASEVRSTTADLNASIDPNGFATGYHFEFGDQGPCSANPCTSVPIPDLSVGSSDAPDNLPLLDPLATRHIGGLQPDTVYHYRVVATNAGGSVAGADRFLRTFLPAKPFALPDGRAYEMVSPPSKSGADIDTSSYQTRVALDGNAVTFASLGVFADARGSALGSMYLARRAPGSGWVTHNITPRELSGGSHPLLGIDPPTFAQGEFSADLSTGVFLAVSPQTEGAPNVADVPNLYLRDDLLSPGSGNYRLLSDCLSQPAGPCATPLPPLEGQRIAFADASADFGHVLFQSSDNLVPGASGEKPKVYEWDHGTLRLVSVKPASLGGGAFEEAIVGQDPISNGRGPGASFNTISDDGSRIFFTAGPITGDNAGTGFGVLYMREDHTTTTQLNVSERGTPDPAGPRPARYLIANSEGTRVFFETAEKLTDDDQNHVYDIYMYEVDAPVGERLTLISHGDADGPSLPGDPLDPWRHARGSGIAGASEDGSYLYFSSDDATLTSGQTPVEGHQGLYVWHEGSVRYIGEFDQGPSGGPYSTYPGEANIKVGSRVTPDGKYLVFVTSHDRNLTGFETGQTSSGGRAPAQVYVYDYEADELACVSCSPANARPLDDANVGRGGSGAMGLLTTPHLSRAITVDGRRVFFSSPDPLVPEDTNGHYDAYEYETETGELHLLSTGQCACDSYFMGASREGDDVFIVTRQRLVGIDVDTSFDLYDARVGGGIAAQNPIPPFQCQGDACQSPATPPNDPTPASAAFSGPGNPAAKSVKKKQKHLQRERAHKRRRAKEQRAAKQRAASAKRGGTR